MGLLIFWYTKVMRIFLAADHAGYQLKEKIKEYLQSEGHEVEDCGAFGVDPSDDYPDFIAAAADKLSKNPEARAILFGGSGQGEAMVANRCHGVRAAVWYGSNTDIIKLSREHNNANALSIGARFVSEDEAKKAIDLWLQTEFTGEDRHSRRIAKIDNQMTSG